MRNFTMLVAKLLPILLAVVALGMVGAGSINPSPMFEGEPGALKGTITGLITLPNGNPAADVSVKIMAPRTGGGSEGTFESSVSSGSGPMPMGPSKSDQVIARAKSDARGRYTVDVPAGIYKVVAMNPGNKAEANVEVVTDQKVEVNLKMERVEKPNGGVGGDKN